MPFARNAVDGSRVYFEDDGGDGAAVVLQGGLVDSIASVRGSQVARGLAREEFRLVFVDHRGLGRSDKPHEVEAYAMRLRVADTIAVLDELGLERAHYVGNSWGGRLGFGIGEHAAEPRALTRDRRPAAVRDGSRRARSRGGHDSACSLRGSKAAYDRSSTRWRPSPTFRFRTSCGAVARQRRGRARRRVACRARRGRGLSRPSCLAPPLPRLCRGRGRGLLRAGAPGRGGDPACRVRRGRGARPRRRAPPARRGAAGRAPNAAGRVVPRFSRLGGARRLPPSSS